MFLSLELSENSKWLFAWSVWKGVSTNGTGEDRCQVTWNFGLILKSNRSLKKYSNEGIHMIKFMLLKCNSRR